MAIEVELPDGSVVEFPDGTDNATMERALGEYRAAPQASKAARTPRKPASRPTDGMGQYTRYLAGLGSSAVETYKGVKQAGTDAMLRSAAAGSAALGAVGMDDMREGFDRNISAPLARSSGQQMQETAERRETNADLMSTGAGRLGSVVGTAAQFIGPGMLARGTAAAPMLLPRTMAGSAAQGGVIGSVQPVAEAGERGTNATIGAAAGFAGNAIPTVIGGAFRTAGSLVQPFVQRGQERIIANTLRESATAPARLVVAAPSQIPGVTRTLAEESADPGIAQLQRQFPAQMSDVAIQNNAARVGAVRDQFRGADSASVDAIESARDTAANTAMRAINKRAGADPSRLLTQIERIQSAYKGRPHVQSALEEVKPLLRNGDVPEDRVGMLYNARKTINDMVAGKYGSDASNAQAAQRELLAVRSALDRVIGKAAPEFRPYMQQYRQASTEADQARVGMQLLGRGKQAADPNTLERMLTPNTLARAANNPDELVRSATGFKKARADRTLTSSQSALLRNLSDDASRMDFVTTGGRASGSDTAQNLATRNVMRSMMGDSRLGQIIASAQPTQRVASILEKTYGVAGVPQRLQEVMVEALQRPEYARQILGRLPPADRLLLTRAMGRAGGFSGAVSPALAE